MKNTCKGVTVKFSDETDFRICNVYGVGRNYANHARELSNPIPEEPVVFMKSPYDITQEKKVVLPRNVGTVHHECELVLFIGKEGRNIQTEFAEYLISGFAIGIDITLRDIQNRLKSKGLPWTLSKRFDQGGPISAIFPVNEETDIGAIEFSISVNDEKRQIGKVKDMIFSPSQIISFLSSHFTLREGDVIFTGTPEGVGELFPGDNVKLFLGPKQVAEFTFI